LERKAARGQHRRAGVPAIGPGAEAWLIAAAAAGASRVRRKLAEAVDLAQRHGAGHVDEALRAAAVAGRFADGDLAAILVHRGGEVSRSPPGPTRSGRCSAQRALGRASADDRQDAGRAAASG
jgi:hypothetical protein